MGNLSTTGKQTNFHISRINSRSFALAHQDQILKMRFSTAAVALTAIVSGVTAAPTKRQDTGDIDAVILQYALTLEHLENAFYKKALSEWDEEAFTDAGFSSKFYNDLKYVAHDEEGHVVYLRLDSPPLVLCQWLRASTASL